MHLHWMHDLHLPEVHPPGCRCNGSGCVPGSSCSTCVSMQSGWHLLERLLGPSRLSDPQLQEGNLKSCQLRCVWNYHACVQQGVAGGGVYTQHECMHLHWGCMGAPNAPCRALWEGTASQHVCCALQDASRSRGVHKTLHAMAVCDSTVVSTTVHGGCREGPLRALMSKGHANSVPYS